MFTWLLILNVVASSCISLAWRLFTNSIFWLVFFNLTGWDSVDILYDYALKLPALSDVSTTTPRRCVIKPQPRLATIFVGPTPLWKRMFNFYAHINCEDKQRGCKLPNASSLYQWELCKPCLFDVPLHWIVPVCTFTKISFVLTRKTTSLLVALRMCLSHIGWNQHGQQCSVINESDSIF